MLVDFAVWICKKKNCQRLWLFNDITKYICSSNYLTTDIFFPKICKVKHAIDDWIKSYNTTIQNMVEQYYIILKVIGVLLFMIY